MRFQGEGKRKSIEGLRENVLPVSFAHARQMIRISPDKVERRIRRVYLTVGYSIELKSLGLISFSHTWHCKGEDVLKQAVSKASNYCSLFFNHVSFKKRVMHSHALSP